MITRTFKIRPYARLLTMLGEQLIKNEKIALAELIKNSYDADADWVGVYFEGFESDSECKSVKNKEDSKIIIEDNGEGMSLDTIEKCWMNPATPNKKSRTLDEVRKTRSGRVIQGEKGIGRFAILKLGRKIEIVTRPKGSDKEYLIDYDLTSFDDDFLTENQEEKELFLEDINISVLEREATVFVKEKGHGTRIVISNLKGVWDRRKIDDLKKDSLKLEPIFDRVFGKKAATKFKLSFRINDFELKTTDSMVENLGRLLEMASVLKIREGHFDCDKKCFFYQLNGVPKKLELNDPRIQGLSVFRDYFWGEKDLFGACQMKSIECGSFDFNFFIFDFAAEKGSRYQLAPTEKALIKEHRIYLYRDKIRVVPYGDSDNDWLETDKRRATGKAGGYLSNDQVVGFVDITKRGNPKLKDKTNREGLIEEGSATKDFIMLLHSFLLFIRQNPYQQYREQIKKKNEQEIQKQKIVESKFGELKELILGNLQAEVALRDLERRYKIEKTYFQRRVEITEDLAGVGLSVETSSHDLMMMLGRGLDALESLARSVERMSPKKAEQELLAIKEIFIFVHAQMKDIQLLFRSSKQKRRLIQVEDLLEKVWKIYRRILDRENIFYTVEKRGKALLVECTDAVILQLLINLFDNSIHWLKTTDFSVKEIKVLLDGDEQVLIFADSGPGIQDDDKPYIFEAFYSGKEEGRGLGLYIARQLLERMNATIYLLDKLNTQALLSGANFLINFGGKKND